MRIKILPSDAKLVFDNLFVDRSGQAYAYKPSTNSIESRRKKQGDYIVYKPRLCSHGYKVTTHYKKQHRIHRLVAEAFIPNPLGLPHVNHIDSDRTNCSISNLEWVTASENQVHAYREGGRKHLQTKINQLDLDGNLIKEHDSLIQAAEAVDGCRVAIGMICRGVGRSITSAGFKWEYA